MGLYSETNWKKPAAAAALCAAFLIIYLPWLSGNRELFRDESIYAVKTVEFGRNLFQVTAHGMPQYSNAPLFPAVSKLIWQMTGLPLEMVMRGISMFMLASGAVLVYFATASQREPRAGWVAAAFYLTPLIALEKVVEGNPVTMAAFFLAAAQLLFFYYGIRRSNWNKAWIFSAILLALSFLSGGFAVLFYFVIPMFFFRRPLSVKSKFNAPGFAVAVLLLAVVIVLWTVPVISSGNDLYDIWLDSFLFYKSKYLLELIEFPLLLPLRLLPWSLIAWLPFCVALQDLDSTPIFSRYLRTLFCVTLVIVWIFNDSESRAIIYLLAPLSILSGITYGLGTRRYGERIRNWLAAGEILVISLAAAFAAVIVMPENILSFVISLKNSLSFRYTPFFLLTACAGCALLITLAVVLHLTRRKQPLWSMLLLISVCCGIFYGGVMNPYRAQIKNKRKVGEDIKKAMQPTGGNKIYKLGINDLYGELFYSGLQVKKIISLKDIPNDEPVVYLIGTEFPGTTDRSWINLLPPDYSYNNHPLLLWKGILRQNAE